MASSTSANYSSIQKSSKYDVFLSFRGEDTRKNFVDHLYHALKQKGVYTYRDEEEIKKGKRINHELIRSIEDSKFYIIVFSKNYVSSSWCLDELMKIMECHKTNKHTAFPVFFDVEPTEVRKQSGAVGEAFAKHEEEEEAAGRWRGALKEAADLAGWELKNTFDGHEAMLIEKIVEEISLELRFFNPMVDGRLIGMEERVKRIVSSLETDTKDVRMLGIKGMGGAGKTTLARAVFDQIFFHYEGSSFVGNVSEISKNPSCGLKYLQKQVLSDVLNDQNITVRGVSDMKRMMCGRKVLVVLDDVDHIDQLEELAGELNWFKPGSRIIITTREEQVLVAHGMPENLILDVSLLSNEEANCLFNRYAFGRVVPNQGYENLASQVVHYAAGLPLTIKVLGSDLRGKNELEWKERIKRLKTIPLKETLEKLELSYDSLEEEYKEIFLEVACMLKGWEKEKAIIVLESRGFYARIGLRVLEQKSLITISKSTGLYNLSMYDQQYLSMHDHLEEMGKNIVRRLYPNQPQKHSCLWIKEETNDILAADKGTEATRDIKVWTVDPLISMKGLRKMKELRFLDVKFEGKPFSNFRYSDLCYSKFGEGSPYLPNGLQYLRWTYYNFTSLPKKFQANNLVGLEIHFSKIHRLWKRKKNKVLEKLRFIDLYYCYELRSLDIGLIPNLERLDIEMCPRLAELHTPVKHLNLRSLTLTGCAYELRILDLEWALNLDTLEVQSDYLTEIRMPVGSGKLKHLNLRCSVLKALNLMRTQNYLETLDLEYEHLVQLHMMGTLHIGQAQQPDIWYAQHLGKLKFVYNVDLVEFHFPVGKLKYLRLKCSRMKTLNLMQTQNLETLYLKDCKDLVELHVPIESPKLQTIHIHCSKLKTLNITGARNLERLILEQCEDLLELHMPIESAKLKTIHIHCSKLRTLNISGARNLESLILEQCEDLLELHMPIEIPKLKTINIGCSKLRALNIIGARNLEILDLNQCEDLLELDMPIESFELKSINIPCSKLRTLNLMGAVNLKTLDLKPCKDLEELHMPMENPELKSINILSSKLRTLNITGARNLESIDLEQCDDLLELQMPKENPKLKTINIPCSKLRTLYLGLLPYLEHLDLHDCFNLVEIQAPVGCLSGRFTFKPFLVNQVSPLIGSSVELHLTARSLGICPLHPENNLPKFYLDCNYKELPLASTQINLAKLVSFGQCACTSLASLSRIFCGFRCLGKLTLEGSIPQVPNELDQLECLEKLTLLKTNIEHLPDSICALKHLKFLRIKSCQLLQQLPENLGRLECLEELHIEDCTSLRDIPNNICEMKHLKCFHLINCILVEKLPKEIGCLPCLKELYIEGTGITDPPESIFQLKGLLFFPKAELESNEFTSVLQNTDTWTSCTELL